MRKAYRQKGFTLIEVIAVLMVVGVLAAFAGMGIVTAVQGYLFSKDNAAISEKAQLAISRINREFQQCYDCSSTITGNSFTYLNPLGNRTINWGSLPIIQLSNTTSTDTLIDKVSAFGLSYNTSDRCINVTMSLTGVPNSFSTKVYPRNTP